MSACPACKRMPCKCFTPEEQRRRIDTLAEASRAAERARMALLDARATRVKTLAGAGWIVALFVLVAAIAHYMAKVCR